MLELRIGPPSPIMRRGVTRSVCGMQEGQAVTFVGGAFSEYSTVPAAGCWPVQDASPQAACLAISGLTAIGALEVCTLVCTKFAARQHAQCPMLLTGEVLSNSPVC